MGTDYYLYEGEITREGLRKLTSCIHERCKSGKCQSKAILYLVTSGGDPDAAYKIARLFQSIYSQFDVAIPLYCKSAGTLIACGAHTIHYEIDGELGPLDMQLSRDDEIYGQLSSLVATKGLEDVLSKATLTFETNLLQMLNKSKGRLGTKTAADIAVKLTDALYRPIMEQFDPMRVGEHARSTEVASEYGGRLNQAYRNLLPDALGQLIYGYPSHGFVIDVQEAKMLFTRVQLFTEELRVFLQQGIRIREEHDNVFFIGEQDDEEQTSQKSNIDPVSGSESSQKLDGEINDGRDEKSEGLRKLSSQEQPSGNARAIKAANSR